MRMARKAKTNPSGTVIKKRLRQEASSSRNPPRLGPLISPRETAMPINPRPRPSCSLGKVSLMIAGPAAIIIAPPRAWQNRAAIRKARAGA